MRKFSFKDIPESSNTRLKKGKINFFSDKCPEEYHLNKLKYFSKYHNKLCCASCIAKIKDKENCQHKDCEVCLLNKIKTNHESIKIIK